MIEVVWKRCRAGLLEAYIVKDGKHRLVGFVLDRFYRLADEIPIREASSETAAQLALVEEYNKKGVPA